MKIFQKFILVVATTQFCFAETYEIANPVNPEILERRIRASYGFLSKREPALNSSEYAIIDRFLPFLEEDPQFAIEMIEGLTENNPSLTASFHLTLGNLYFQSERLKDARSAYRDAVEKYPDFLRAWKAIGLLDMNEGNFESAKKALGRAIQLGDTDPETFGLLGFAYFSTGEYLASQTAYEQASLYQPEAMDWTRGQVASLQKLNNFQPVRIIMEAHTKKNPDDAKGWAVLANSYLRLKQPLKAAAVIELMRSRQFAEPRHLDSLTSVYLDKKLFRAAGEIIVEQLEKGHEVAARKLIACLTGLLDSGFETIANELFSTIQRYETNFEPKHRVALLDYQGRIAMRKADYAMAAAHYKTALEISDDPGPILLQLGIVNLLAGDFLVALETLEESALYPESRQRALYVQAQVLIQQRNYDAALEKLLVSINEGGGERPTQLYEQTLQAARKAELDRLTFNSLRARPAK